MFKCLLLSFSLLLSSEPFFIGLFLMSSICMLLVVNLLLETELRLFTPF